MEPRRRRRRELGGYGRFVLMTLLRMGPMSQEELEEQTFVLASPARALAAQGEQRVERAARISHKRKESRAEFDELSTKREADFEELRTKGLVFLNDSGKFELTELGRDEAVELSTRMGEVAGVVQRLARSSPSRPKMPQMSAWVVAPFMWPSAPQLYSVTPILVPG